MNFTSDNWAGVHPAITDNLARHASGMAAAYGTSELDRRIERRFSEIFEREVAVDEVLARLVTSFATMEEEVAEFAALLA